MGTLAEQRDQQRHSASSRNLSLQGQVFCSQRLQDLCSSPLGLRTAVGQHLHERRQAPQLVYCLAALWVPLQHHRERCGTGKCHPRPASLHGKSSNQS